MAESQTVVVARPVAIRWINWMDRSGWNRCGCWRLYSVSSSFIRRGGGLRPAHLPPRPTSIQMTALLSWYFTTCFLLYLQLAFSCFFSFFFFPAFSYWKRCCCNCWHFNSIAMESSIDWESERDLRAESNDWITSSRCLCVGELIKQWWWLFVCVCLPTQLQPNRVYERK